MAVTFWYHGRWLNLIKAALLTVCSLICIVAAKEVNYNNLEIKGNELALPQLQTFPRQYPQFPQQPIYGGMGGIGGIGSMGGIGGIGGMFGGCPLCDSSVYSYCSYKMLHDSCCCDFPVGYLKPQQCYYSDCSLLYAKSCYEYSLIRNCCCNNPY